MKLANNGLHYLHGVLAAIMIASHLVLVPVLDGNIAWRSMLPMRAGQLLRENIGRGDNS